MSGTHGLKQQMNIKTHKSDMPFPYIFTLQKVDVLLQWMYCRSGCSAAVDVVLQWMYCCSGCTAAVDVLLQWM
jgi:hypothetical protein